MRIIRIFRHFRSVVLISRDVCRAASKERLMYGFLLLALLFILLANVPFMINDPKLLDGQSPSVAAVQIGFVSINIFTILIAVFVSLSTLQSFLSRDSLILLLSKPVKRWQVLEGVVLGLFEMLFMNWFLMTMGVWLVFVSQTRSLGFFLWTGMSVTALMAFLYVNLIVFFYCLIPNAMAGIFAVLLIIAGFGVPLAHQAFNSAEYPVFIRGLFHLTLNILPQINSLWGLSMQQLALFDLKINGAPIVLQTFAVIAILNLISCARFRRLSRT